MVDKSERPTLESVNSASSSTEAQDSQEETRLSEAALQVPEPSSARRTKMAPDDVLTQSEEAPEIELAHEEVDFQVTLADLPSIANYGRYELLGRLAYGGMAEIFLSRELRRADMKRLIVIKRILPHIVEDETFVGMFLDEARLAMQLNHPNICHVYDFGEEQGTYFLAMEWVDGMPLSKIIRRARREKKPLPISFVLKVIAQVACALDYAHRAADASGQPLGIIHRDVSPQNIMVSYDGTVKLLDFGIAKAESHSTHTEAGVIKGKFAYMSPQQCTGEVIDSRSDIFALGVCLFEALAGRNPFRRKSEFETMSRIVSEANPVLRAHRADVPSALESVLQKAIAKMPEDRYQKAADFQFALESVLSRMNVVMHATRIGEVVADLFEERLRQGPKLDTRLALPESRPSMSHSVTETSMPEVVAASASGTQVDREALTREAPHLSVSSKRGGSRLWMALGVAVLAAILWIGDVYTATDPDTPLSSVSDADVTTSVEPSPTPTVVVNEVVPTTGALYLRSTPAGATVRLNEGDPIGVTPLEIGMLEVGVYRIQFTHEGFQTWEGQVQVGAGQRVSLNPELETEATPASPPVRRRVQAESTARGQLSINSRPWSKVYLGRRLLGTTPLGRQSVPAGRHRLRLVDRDGHTHSKVVVVAPDGHTREAFDLRQ